MASLDSPISALATAWKVLRQQWDDTHQVWNDSVNRSFEKQYWSPIEDCTHTTLKEMQNLAQVIADAQRRVR